MTKICGLASNEIHPSLGQDLNKIYAASWQKTFTRKEMWCDAHVGLGHFGIGAVNPEPQPVIDSASGTVGVFCGKIFDYSTERRLLQKEGVKFQWPQNDAEFLLHKVNRFKAQSLREINGIFSLAIWDSVRNKLLLAGDRYGFRPLYYYHDVSQGVLVFASDIKAILATGLPRLRVNWPAVNVFLRFGHALGDETLFEGIYRLPPASVLTFKNNKVRLERYWQLVDLPIQENMTMDEAVDGCVGLFQQAIQRRLKTSAARHIVTLSGGQDSRHIAAELKRQGVEFTTYTTTSLQLTNQEKILAELVAKTLGVPHVFVPNPTKDFLSRYWSRAHILLEYETDLHQWGVHLLDALPDEPHINFDGIVGDVCLCSIYLKPHEHQLAREGRLDELTQRVVEQDLYPSILHESIMRHLDRGVLYEHVRAQFQKFAGHRNLLMFTSLSNRTRRAISLFAFKVLAEKVESYYPFADNDYFDFAMSIPPEYKLDRKMHMRVLDRAYPDLRDVPTSKEINKRDYLTDEMKVNYYKQKRQYLWQGLLQMIQGRPWIFNRRKALPRLVRDLVQVSFKCDRSFFLCNPAIAVLAQWFEEYFPDGVE